MITKAGNMQIEAAAQDRTVFNRRECESTEGGNL